MAYETRVYDQMREVDTLFLKISRALAISKLVLLMMRVRAHAHAANLLAAGGGRTSQLVGPDRRSTAPGATVADAAIEDPEGAVRAGRVRPGAGRGGIIRLK